MNELLKSRSLRNDLLFRLSVIQFFLPPLRERKSDILQIADHYRKKYNQIYKKKITGFTKELQHHMLHYAWPGNVRELQNVISSAYATCEDSLITLDNLPKIITVNQKEERIMEDIEHLPLKEKMNRFEKMLLEEALRSNKSMTAAATSLGIERSLLYKKLKKYHLKE